MSLFQQSADGSYLEPILAIEEALWTTLGLGNAEILQLTWSCVVPRPYDEGDDAESSRRACKRFFCVYIDNLVPGNVTREC